MDTYSINKPSFFVFDGARNDAVYFAASREKNGAGLRVSVLDGSKMQDMDGLYDEYALGFRFPSYFGRNWAALEECMLDLEWFPAKAYLIVVLDAPLVLRKANTGDAAAFLRLLARVVNDWNSGSPVGAYPARGPLPFHVAFHTYTQDVVRYRNHVAEITGEPVSTLDMSS